ncbi:hypothetical protein E1A91_A11G308900v1, partial [Gossypium mustelinum]
MWYKLIPSCYISQFFWMNLINWIIGNMENNVGLHVGSIECGIYFAVLCWFLWKNKNRVIFQHDSVHPKEVLRRTKSLATNICSMMRTDNLKS